MELIRDTFRKLNCRIVQVNELNYMMDLDRNVAISFFTKLVIYNNIVIIKTITSTNCCHLMNLLIHLDIFNMEEIRRYGMNSVIYKSSNDTMVRTITASALNIFEGFMKCIKLPNKKMCDICNNEKTDFRECAKCKNKICVECFKNHNKDCVNSCPYCRNNIAEHSKRIRLLEDMMMGGDLT